jgi:hypothetical protein
MLKSQQLLNAGRSQKLQEPIDTVLADGTQRAQRVKTGDIRRAL